MELEKAQELRYTVGPPGRKARIESYLWDKADELCVDSAESLHNPDKPLPNYGVLIPVAAHQESGRVYHSLSEYAKQEGADDFTVCLLFNYPADLEDSPQVEATMREFFRAQADFSQLDIRYLKSGYLEPVPIGQIRKDLWDPIAMLARTEGIYDQPDGEFIAINHDIDTESIGKHYIRNIQRYYEQARREEAETRYYPNGELEVRATQVKHAYPFETHPNIAKVILWQDFIYRRVAPNGLYEEGMVIPISRYAMAGGFLPDKQTYETHNLTRSAFRGGRLCGIAGTMMDTSPRRYIARLEEQGSTDIWSDQTFGNNDSCRDKDRLPGDISFDRMEYIIFNDLEKSLAQVIKGVDAKRWSELGVSYMMSREMSDEELTDNVSRIIQPKIKLARAVLARVTGSTILPDLVDMSAVADDVDQIAYGIKSIYGWSQYQ